MGHRKKVAEVNKWVWEFTAFWTWHLQDLYTLIHSHLVSRNLKFTLTSYFKLEEEADLDWSHKAGYHIDGGKKTNKKKQEMGQDKNG